MEHNSIHLGYGHIESMFCVLNGSVMSDSLWSHGLEPPGSSVHGIFQVRILEWVAISFSRGSSQPRDWTWVSCLVGGFFTTELPGKTRTEFLWPNPASCRPNKNTDWTSIIQKNTLKLWPVPLLWFNPLGAKFSFITVTLFPVLA